MKPRIEKPHPRKRENQERKAARLTLAIEKLARQSKLSALEVFGRLTTEQQWTLLLTVADPLVLAGKKKAKSPSPETMWLILRHLSARVGKGWAA